MEQLRQKKLFLLDIDGTICKGDGLIDGAGAFLEVIRQRGGQFIFITNNATRSTRDYIRFFRQLGVETGPDQYITAAYATIQYLKEHCVGRLIYGLATDSFLQECRENGIHITTSLQPGIDCVLVSYDNQLNYEKIKDVCRLLTEGEPEYIATNPDLVCPVEFGYLPDCGAICNMIETATGKRPRFIGKPEPAMVEYALQRTGCTPEETLVVGDRLYTDILCGVNAGVDTALVLSGEATLQDAAAFAHPPRFLFPSVKELAEAIVPTRSNAPAMKAVVQTGTAEACAG